MSILANESSALISYLPPFFPAKPLPPYDRKEIFFNTFVPFELILFYAILPMHLGGDRYAVVEELQDIIQGCKREHFRSQDNIWKDRMEETGLAMAGVLVEMGELSLGARLLMDLAKQQGSIQAYKAAFLVYLEMGLVNEAEAVLQTLKGSNMSEAEVLVLEAVHMLAIGDASGAEEKANAAEHVKADQTLVSFPFVVNRFAAVSDPLIPIGERQPFIDPAIHRQAVHRELTILSSDTPSWLTSSGLSRVFKYCKN